MSETNRIKIFPLTPDRWADLETLFGPRGAVGGCWCMYWRLKRSEFDLLKGEGNRAALKDLVDEGSPPGLIAYQDEKPVGWVSLAPRQEFSTLERSRTLARVDDLPVWSVVCFYIDKNYRRQGLSSRLLEAAAEFARAQGASILEGYPVEPKEGIVPPVFAFTGLASVFRDAGFVEVERRSATRPIMRKDLSGV
jgi:GNAT superfamily N-acetyltransferase